jgi:hypothetical protein
MKMKYDCPKCGQPGGVLLFTSVGVCDPCLSKGRSKYVVRCHYRDEPMPSGAIAWNAYDTMDARDGATNILREWLSRTNGDPVIDKMSDGLSVIAFGGMDLFSTDEPRHSGFQWWLSVSRSDADIPQSRGTRIVGTIPDPWQGASFDQRWMEGREIRMILQIADVPARKIMNAWMYVEYSSAHDYVFNNIEFIVRPLIIHPHRWWMNSLPAPTRQTAESRLAADYILFVVD